MNAMEFGSHIHSVKPSGKEFIGLCPGHDDRKASLSWRDGEKGVVVTCHAGCTIEAITGALGLKAADLFSTNGHLPPAPVSRRLAAHYPYHDEHGTLLYEAVRGEPKKFSQRQPDGKGGWIWNITNPAVRQVLYRLPSVQGQTEIWVCEGEKDCDRLAAAGLEATTNPMGAGEGKWKPEFTGQLKEAGVEQVMVLPDNDPPGEAHGRAIAESCLDAGLAVKIVMLHGLPPKGDVSDWLDAGHTVDELRLLATRTPAYKGILFTVEGDVYRCAWPHLGITVSFDQISNHSAGLHAEITVKKASRHLHWARMNLSSSTARSGLAKLLETRTKEHAIDWQEVLETACVKTAQVFRAPAEVVDLATVDTTNVTRYLVQPLMVLHSTNILYGDGGTGKSRLALAMALAVKGVPESDPETPLLPYSITPMLHGPVLYLDYETCEEDQASELQALAIGHCSEMPSIHYLRVHRPLIEWAAPLRAMIQRLGIVLLVVDSMGPATGGKQEEAEAVIAFMNALHSLGPSVTRLVVSHISKADGDRQRARIYGSVFARNLARSCWEVRSADEEETTSEDGTSAHIIGLFHGKVNRGRLHKPFGLRFTFTHNRITTTAQDLMAYPSLAVAAPLKDRVRQLMGEGVTLEHELSRQLEVKPARIRHAMEQIKRACGLGKVG